MASCKCSLHFCPFFLLRLLSLFYIRHTKTNEELSCSDFLFTFVRSYEEKKNITSYGRESARVSTLPGQTDCQLQTKGYEGAKYKSFESREEAEKPLPLRRTRTSSGRLPLLQDYSRRRRPSHRRRGKQPCRRRSLQRKSRCHGVPGSTRRQPSGNLSLRADVWNQQYRRIPRHCPRTCLVETERFDMPIYSDSVNAINWIKQKNARQTAARRQDRRAFHLIERAEKWLRENTYTTRILKWETKQWGNSGRLRKVKTRAPRILFHPVVPASRNDAAELMNE